MEIKVAPSCASNWAADVLAFFRLVRKMRVAQYAYENAKTTRNFQRAADLEKSVDSAVRFFFSGVLADLVNDVDDDLPF